MKSLKSTHTLLRLLQEIIMRSQKKTMKSLKSTHTTLHLHHELIMKNQKKPMKNLKLKIIMKCQQPSPLSLQVVIKSPSQVIKSPNLVTRSQKLNIRSRIPHTRNPEALKGSSPHKQEHKRNGEHSSRALYQSIYSIPRLYILIYILNYFSSNVILY